MGEWRILTFSLAGCTLSGIQSAQRHLAVGSIVVHGAPRSAALEKNFQDMPET